MQFWQKNCIFSQFGALFVGLYQEKVVLLSSELACNAFVALRLE